MSATRTVATKTVAKPSTSASPAIVLQRKCACGGSAGLTGDCEDCKEEKLLGGTLQRKLAINEVGDDYEREADRVADQVLGMRDRGSKTGVAGAPSSPLVQRRTAGNTNAGIGAAPSIVHDVLASPGQPLDATTRAYFEPRFGHDFANVRVHSDARAADSARSVDARAYTVGDHIIFGAGQARRNSEVGNRLLAHELVHVVQQRGQASDPPVRADTSGTLRRIPMEGQPLKTDLANERMRQLDKQRAGLEPGPGVPWEELKKAGFGWLIERATALREAYIAGLRERASSLLPAGLQPAAQGFIDVVAMDLMFLVDHLFFDAGLIVGLGEGIVQMVVGLLQVIIKLLEVAWHYVLGTIYGVQQELAKLGISNQPSEELIRPLDEDLAAAEQLWREFPDALAGYFQDWANRFQQGSREEKAIMAGDFTADVLLFIGTWEASATRLGKLRIPPLKMGVAPAPTPVVSLAGGGSMAIETGATGGLSIPGTTVGVGGPIGAGGVTVTRMAGRDRESGSKPKWDEDPVNVLREEMRKAEVEVGELRNIRKQIDDLVRETSGALTEDGRVAAMYIRQEILDAVIPGRVAKLDELIKNGRGKEAIAGRGLDDVEKTQNLLDDIDWLRNADDDHKKLAYDPDTGKYRVDEARSILRFMDEPILGYPVTRSAFEGYDYFDLIGHWSVKGNFQNKTSKGITTDLLNEVMAGRNLLADLDSAQIGFEIQREVRKTVDKVTGWMTNKTAPDIPGTFADFQAWARTNALDLDDSEFARRLWERVRRDSEAITVQVHFLTYTPTGVR